MSSGSHLRNLFHEFHVFGTMAKFIIANQGSERRATEDAEFFLINFLKKGALVEFRSKLKIAQQFTLGHIQDFDLQHVIRFALIEQVFQASPTGFQLLKFRVVENFIDLRGNQFIYLRDAGIDGGLNIPGDSHRPLENLVHKFPDQVLAAFAGNRVTGEPAFFYDLLQ